MATFADLLTSYMARAGVGDAEFARRLGVSRLTLIRWKEGVTQRPRYREDVLRCAELLRLEAGERDALLLAAGFAPEAPPGVVFRPEQEGTDDSSPVLSEPGPLHTASVTAPVHPGRRKTLGIVVVAALVLAVAMGASVAAVAMSGGTDHPTAADGESLILMAPFTNYTSGQQGFNVRGRLRQEIDREIGNSGLSGVRTADWPTAIASESEATEAGRRSGAVMVIWGEYDSGRVMAAFTVPQSRTASRQQHVVDIDSSPSDLPAAINIDLPGEVRSAALLTLGELYLNEGEFDLAKKALLQALAQPPIDPGTLASLRYRLGHAYMSGRSADLDEAIWLFTQVLSVDPGSANAYSSRGVAHLERGREGDAGLAIRDLTQAVTINHHSEGPYVNRAVAYLERNNSGDLDRALADLATALSINPESTSALVNRANAYLERGRPRDRERAMTDLERAIDLQPGLASAHAGMGNAFLEQGGESGFREAVEAFTRAIELEPDSPMAYFNRGLAYSALEEWDRSTADLHHAQELDPSDAKFNDTLCWQLGVQRRPERALPFCNLALATDPDGPARDSRGLVYAVMGRNAEAVADFEIFLRWVDLSVKKSCRAKFRPTRLTWIEKLESGRDPFDAETLRDIRARPIASRDAPC